MTPLTRSILELAIELERICNDLTKISYEACRIGNRYDQCVADLSELQYAVREYHTARAAHLEASPGVDSEVSFRRVGTAYKCMLSFVSLQMDDVMQREVDAATGRDAKASE